jgi:DNA-binding CsgD family transcriptional regulator
VTSARVNTGQLLERAAELAQLDDALRAACSRTGATVLVEGPAGIGKTSLLSWTRRRAAARGMTVLHGSGSELERDYAMGLVRQTFEPELRRHDDHDVLLAGAARLAARALFDVPDDEDPAPGGVLHGLYWLTANIADRAPVLLAIDDAHWADEPSLLFVAYLARRVESLAVALVVGTRPGEDATVAAVLDELRRAPATSIVEPAPLDVAGVDELLRAVQTGPVEREFAAACQEATGGNPFLLGELVRALRAGGVPFTAIHADRVTQVTPPTVTRSVRSTLARLDAAGQALAHAVAVLGDGVGLDLVAELADVPPAAATLAAAELARAGLLADAAPLRFRHPLLAGAVRAALSVSERTAAHGRAAALLRRRHSGAERVALQLMHTSPAGDSEVVAELRDAAARARRRGALSTAIALLRRALEEPPPQDARAEILLDLGRAEGAMGRSANAAAHLEEAHRRAVDPVLRGHVVLSLFNAVGGHLERLRELEPLIARARAEVATHDRELAMRLWAIHQVATPSAELPDIQAGALQLPGDTPGEALVLGHLVFPMLHHATGAKVAEVAERAARQARPLLDEGAVALVMSAIYPGLFALDRLDELEELLAYAITAARRRGSSAEVSLAYGARAEVRRRAGRLSEAESDARIAVAAAGEAGWGGSGVTALAQLVGVLVDRGRSEEAAQELAATFPDRATIPDSPATNFLFFERVRLRLSQARHAEAIDEFDEAARRFEPVFGTDSVQWTATCCAAAEAHAALGDRAAATALIERALVVARRWGIPGFIGQALHAKARIEDRDAAIETLREAVAHLERSPARLEHAKALVTLGAFQRRRGERVESREPLRAGYELANACGGDALAETARAELRVSGVRVRRETLSGADALTPSERRIAETAAAGSSNAEIAQALFLTAKTVEMHLTSAYRKLDIRSRRDLSAALGT